ncbi:hypothetical protein IEQ34_010444 [Dendrobium chrysotoxum]|uniref:Uncharacterized protein n=1 Tax=Dendrobium chrysotoxum TaxID=161865 RepID=A0AAV7GSU7_DENCH|nr:hypothetical protein IEQ34_010444 [Dendrobium chrysotoxum]
MGPGRRGGARAGWGIATVAEPGKARAGRSAGTGANVSPCSCIRTLIRSSGWVEHPATMDAIPPSTNPLKPILSNSKENEGDREKDRNRDREAGKELRNDEFYQSELGFISLETRR